MKNPKNSITIILMLLLSLTTFAQFPGGGGMRGGGGDSDLKGRNQNNGMPGIQTQQEPLEKGPNKITGSIIDSVSKKAVEYASLVIYKKGDLKKPVEGGMTDDFGKFSIKGLPDGDYVLKVTFIGYEDKFVTVPTFTKGNREFKAKDIILGQSTKLLNEVTISGQKSLLEDKVDRLVYNADVDKTAQGGNAGDVLRKVPMLTVDLEGNLSMRGSQNVTVLINNKPSTIMASSVADALKQIPAEMIKTVEVITSPSAKYDAEGTAGIVNIITKKNNLQGLTGMINTSAGTVGSNAFGNLNLKKGKLSTGLSGGGNMFYNRSGLENSITSQRNGAEFLTTQDGSARNNGLFGNIQLSFDYELTKKSSITASVRNGRRQFNNTQDLESNTFRNKVVQDALKFNRKLNIKNENNNVDINIDYIKTFSKPQKEFSILNQISRSRGNNDFDADLLSNTDEILSRQRNDNNTLNQEMTTQIDFQTPIKKNQIFEIGGKSILRNISNDFAYFTGNLEKVYTLDPNLPANSFGLDQNIAASYVSYTYSTKNKMTFKMGSRYEYTFNDGEFQGGKKLNIADYGNYIPSLQISKKVAGGTTVKTSYNRRIQRPSMRFLSPNTDLSNPQSISTGNPELLPELTDAFELGLSMFKKANSLNITTFHRRTNDAITQVRSVLDNGVIQSRSENIGQERTFGANIYGSTRITQKWQLNLGSNLYYALLSNPLTNAKNDGWVLEGNYFLMGQLKKGWGIQSFGFIRGPKVELQGRQAGYFMMNLGARKEFALKNGNKGNFGLAIDNPLTQGFRLKSTFESPAFSQQNVRIQYNRGVRLTFGYQFGKMTFAQTRKRSVNNDDTKQEDNGGQGGGQPRGGGGPR